MRGGKAADLIQWLIDEGAQCEKSRREHPVDDMYYCGRKSAFLSMLEWISNDKVDRDAVLNEMHVRSLALGGHRRRKG